MKPCGRRREFEAISPNAWRSMISARGGNRELLNSSASFDACVVCYLHEYTPTSITMFAVQICLRTSTWITFLHLHTARGTRYQSKISSRSNESNHPPERYFMLRSPRTLNRSRDCLCVACICSLRVVGQSIVQMKGRGKEDTTLSLPYLCLRFLPRFSFPFLMSLFNAYFYGFFESRCRKMGKVLCSFACFGIGDWHEGSGSCKRRWLFSNGPPD